MTFLLQGFPITSQNIDHLLSLDPLTLVLLVLLVVVGVDFLKSWFRGRSKSASDNQQTAVIKFFTDEKSPMVISSNRVAAAVEENNKLNVEQTAVLSALTSKINSEIAQLGQQTAAIQELKADFGGYQSTAADAMEEQTKSVDQLIVTVAQLKLSVDAMVTLHSEFAPMKEQVQEILSTVQIIKGQQNKRATSEQKAVPGSS